MTPTQNFKHKFTVSRVGSRVGQNPKIFKPRQIIYQNEALGALITKKWFPRSLEVIRPQIMGYLGSFGVKIQIFSNLDKLYTKMKLLVPCDRLRRRNLSTNYLEGSEGLRRDRSINYLERSEKLWRQTSRPTFLEPRDQERHFGI